MEKSKKGERELHDAQFRILCLGRNSIRGDIVLRECSNSRRGQATVRTEIQTILNVCYGVRAYSFAFYSLEPEMSKSGSSDARDSLVHLFGLKPEFLN